MHDHPHPFPSYEICRTLEILKIRIILLRYKTSSYNYLYLKGCYGQIKKVFFTEVRESREYQKKSGNTKKTRVILLKMVRGENMNHIIFFIIIICCCCCCCCFYSDKIFVSSSGDICKFVKALCLFETNRIFHFNPYFLSDWFVFSPPLNLTSCNCQENSLSQDFCQIKEIREISGNFIST